MTVPIVGELEFDRKPITGRLADNVASLTLSLATSDVSEAVIQIIDPRLRLLATNQFFRGREVTWKVAGFTRHLVIAVIEVADNNDVEMLTLTCRPAAVEQLRNYRGAFVWAGMSPTEWLANECASAAKDSHLPVKFIGQPTTTRSQILRRAEKGQVPESSWDVAGALASEEGFWLFEHASTVYFAQPSWLATELAASFLDRWIWPRPADGKTPFMKIPRCRVSDYAQKADLQPATIDAEVAMEYAMTLSPGQSAKVEIPQFRGRYLITRVSIVAGEPLAKVTLNSPVDPAPHTSLVTVNSNTVEGSDPTGHGLTDLQVGAYAYNGLVMNGAVPTEEAVAIAIAIAFRESKFITSVHNDNASTGDDSWGLWQINVLGGIHGQVRTRWEALTHSGIPWPEGLTDPVVNAFGMGLLSGGGKSWQPWSTYNRNDYLTYLPTARVVATQVFQLPHQTFDAHGFGPDVTDKLLQIPASPPPDPNATNAAVEQFVQFALSKRGDKYVIGGITDSGYDCSGLVYAALKFLGKSPIPRDAISQYNWCKNADKLISINAAAKIRGALLFKTINPAKGTTGHVVISLGDGVHTIEAMGTQWGVVEGTIGGRFDHAGLVPVLDYPGNIYALIATTP